MAREVLIQIDYPGDCISVNHYLGKRRDGGYYVKQEAKEFMTELGWLIKPYHLEDYKLPLEVTCSGYFENARAAPDLSNLSKCIMDTIEEITRGNDKNYRWHDGERVIGVEKPYLVITIKEAVVAEMPPASVQCDSSGIGASAGDKLPK